MGKYESAERYWSNKCQRLDEDLFDLSRESKEHQDKGNRLHNTLVAKNQEIDDLANTIAALKSKKDRKEEMIDSLQNRIGDTMKENGEYHKELSLRMEELSKLKENLNDAEIRIGELKAVIRENERNLTEIHTKAIENSNLNLLRSEELQKKYEGLHVTYEDKCKEYQHLVEKNKELIDLVKDWEQKFNSKLHAHESNRNEALDDAERSYQKNLEELCERYKKEQQKQEEKFQNNMDMLEDEFKKVLMENNEKHKQLKIAYEDKCKNESELKDFMRVTVGKNTEQERLIEQQNDILRRLKDEYTRTLQEKDDLARTVATHTIYCLDNV